MRIHLLLPLLIAGAPICTAAQEAAPPVCPGAGKSPLPANEAAGASIALAGAVAGVRFEDWKYEGCRLVPSAPVVALQALAGRAAAGDPASLARLRSELQSAWPQLRDNPRIVPHIGPQAIADILAVNKMTVELTGLAPVASDATIELARQRYERWASPYLDTLYRQARELAKTGSAPYPQLRRMLAIGRDLELLGGAWRVRTTTRSALDAAGDVLQVAFNALPQTIPCEPTRSDVERVLQLSHDLALLTNHDGSVTTGPVRRAIVRYFRAEARRTPQSRAQLATTAGSIGFTGLARELRTGLLEPNEPTLDISVDGPSIAPGASAQVMVTLMGCQGAMVQGQRVGVGLSESALARLSDSVVTTDERGTARALLTASRDTGTSWVVARFPIHDPVSGERFRISDSTKVEVGERPVAGAIVARFTDTTPTMSGCYRSTPNGRHEVVIRPVPGARNGEALASIRVDASVRTEYVASAGCSSPPKCGPTTQHRRLTADNVKARLVVSGTGANARIAYSIDDPPPGTVTVSGQVAKVGGGCADVPTRTTPVLVGAVSGGLLEGESGTLTTPVNDGGTATVRWDLRKR